MVFLARTAGIELHSSRRGTHLLPHGGEQTGARCLAPFLGDCGLYRARARSGALNPTGTPLGLHSALWLSAVPPLRFQVLSHLSFTVPTGPVFSVHFRGMLFSGTRVLWCSRTACVDLLS